jgi:hypothetical protein
MAWTPETVKAQGILPAVLPPISLLPLPPLPRRHWIRIGSQSFPPHSCFLLQPFEHRISRRILPLPPAPALSDEFLIEIHPIGQEYIGNRALILVVAISLERDFFPKGEVRGDLIGSLA